MVDLIQNIDDQYDNDQRDTLIISVRTIHENGLRDTVKSGDQGCHYGQKHFKHSIGSFLIKLYHILFSTVKQLFSMAFEGNYLIVFYLAGNSVSME